MVDEIAREMRIPKSFLAKILQRLAKAGLVQSYVGVKGGFYLTKKPQEINLYEVITAIEGPVALNKCTVNKKSCSLSRTCKVHPIWVTVRKEIEEVLKKNTFQKIRELADTLRIKLRVIGVGVYLVFHDVRLAEFEIVCIVDDFIGEEYSINLSEL